MNKTRRAQVNALYARLTKVQEQLSFGELISELDDIASEIETLKDEEQEGYDNMSENLQGGERGQAIYEAANALEEAHSKVSEKIETLREFDEGGAFTEALENLDNASA